MNRRQFSGGFALAFAVLDAGATDRKIMASGGDPWAAIEAGVGGRLGVAVLDTGNGRLTGRRLDERFAMCSVFKWMLAACVLQRVAEGRERLERRVVFGRDALLEYAPVARAHADGRGMTVGELCAAAIEVSDNTAANLLLAAVGGPAALTRYLRTIGDVATRLDRDEPSMSEATPGDPRDTTTPRAMCGALRAALLGDALAPAGRARLVDWMTATTTGTDRLRAGLPRDWRVADKTGTGEHGTSNHVAVVWPPRRAPLVVAAFLTASPAPAARRDAALADVARTLTAGTS